MNSDSLQSVEQVRVGCVVVPSVGRDTVSQTEGMVSRPDGEVVFQKVSFLHVVRIEPLGTDIGR